MEDLARDLRYAGRQLWKNPGFVLTAAMRDRPVKVYGETAPRVDVTVTLGAVTLKARAAADGHWSAMLPAMTAGGPYTLTAAGGERRDQNSK